MRIQTRSDDKGDEDDKRLGRSDVGALEVFWRSSSAHQFELLRTAREKMFLQSHSNAFLHTKIDLDLELRLFCEFVVTRREGGKGTQNFNI